MDPTVSNDLRRLYDQRPNQQHNVYHAHNAQQPNNPNDLGRLYDQPLIQQHNLYRAYTVQQPPIVFQTNEQHNVNFKAANNERQQQYQPEVALKNEPPGLYRQPAVVVPCPTISISDIGLQVLGSIFNVTTRTTTIRVTKAEGTLNCSRSKCGWTMDFAYTGRITKGQKLKTFLAQFLPENTILGIIHKNLHENPNSYTTAFLLTDCRLHHPEFGHKKARGFKISQIDKSVNLIKAELIKSEP